MNTSRCISCDEPISLCLCSGNIKEPKMFKFRPTEEWLKNVDKSEGEAFKDNKMEFKMCESVGLKQTALWEIKHALACNHPVEDSYIKAKDVEALLACGVKVYGFVPAKTPLWSEKRESCDDSSALLINIKPIVKPVTKKEILEKFKLMTSAGVDFTDLISRIEIQGIE